MGVYPREVETYRHLYTMCTAVIFTTAKTVKTTQCHSAIERNKVLIHAIIWMDLENTMISKRSPTEKATYHMIPLT